MEKADVVIIGSGYGGSIPAYRMAKDGRKVVVLERGKRMETSDFQHSDDPKYVNSVLELLVASNNAALRVGRLVGGASINMDGGCFRLPAHSYTAKDKSGRPYWPESITKEVLAPYYDEAEKVMKIRQMEWNEIPKSGGLFADIFAKAGHKVDRARMNYTDCIHCGYCSVGCRFAKKQSLILNYIPMAEKLGAEFRSECFVDHMKPDGTGFVVHYKKGEEAKEIRGDLVFLAAGGLHSPAVLHRSSNYLDKLPLHVGKHLNFNGESAYIMILPEDYGGLDEYFCYMGMENAGMMCFSPFEDEGFTFHPGGGMEPTMFAAALSGTDDPELPKRTWGLEFKRFVEKVYPHRVFAFSSLGLAEGISEVEKSNNSDTKVSINMTPAYEAYLDRMDLFLDDVAKKSGCKIISAMPRRLHGMTTAHHLSSNRMGSSKDNSVVSPDGYVWNYPNLFCCDASALPYALGVNPALTISANALRVCDYVQKNR
ncbi:MAG: hypothetical protein CL920_29005 [Deltaproteobacteria bacterium]|nr:hypothetical protein [Deltaproteobacteria bacterium]|tara:strand:+ start:17746 stop:19194 length:1449 start_codon:yes stop_codon:yes gene_type:complete